MPPPPSAPACRSSAWSRSRRRTPEGRPFRAAPPPAYQMSPRPEGAPEPGSAGRGAGIIWSLLQELHLFAHGVRAGSVELGLVHRRAGGEVGGGAVALLVAVTAGAAVVLVGVVAAAGAAAVAVVAAVVACAHGVVVRVVVGARRPALDLRGGVDLARDRRAVGELDRQHARARV